MKRNEWSLREELIRINRIVIGQGLIRSSDGNISVRLNRDSLLITPNGVYKSSMDPEDKEMTGRLDRVESFLDIPPCLR